jgi:hypothetical protein
MPDYQEMYCKLFRAQSKAIETLQATRAAQDEAIALLIAAHLETEEIFVQELPPVYTLDPNPKPPAKVEKLPRRPASS